MALKVTLSDIIAKHEERLNDDPIITDLKGLAAEQERVNRPSFDQLEDAQKFELVHDFMLKNGEKDYSKAVDVVKAQYMAGKI